MKVIIAGSRTITDWEELCAAIITSVEKGITISEVVCGGAPGVDRMAEKWARDNKIPVALFKAEWDEHGAKAGPIRNKLMGAYADALIAIWDGSSSGTQHMIGVAGRMGLNVHVRNLSQHGICARRGQ